MLKRVYLFVFILFILLFAVLPAMAQDPTKEPTQVPPTEEATAEPVAVVEADAGTDVTINVPTAEPVAPVDNTQSYLGWLVAVIMAVVMGAVAITGNNKIADAAKVAATLVPPEFIKDYVIRPISLLHQGAGLVYTATGQALDIFSSQDPQETANAIKAGAQDVLVPKAMSAEDLQRFLKAPTAQG